MGDALPALTFATKMPTGPLALGSEHSCMLSAGGILCWGSDALGQLGRGEGPDGGVGPVVISSAFRVRFSAPPDVGLPVAEVSAGEKHTCARLLATGEVTCWGANTQGELGLGHTDSRKGPVRNAVLQVVNLAP
jgi:alpha-tubulin suppressor-like RCC1 family protein